MKMISDDSDQNGPTDKEVKPMVGMGVTICYWTDREPATIIQVSDSGKRIVLQEDSWTRTDNNGFSEDQSYVYRQNPEGIIHFASLRKDGRYKLQKSKTVVSLGVRRKYQDYSF